MTISTQDLLWQCKTTLQDAGATRWTLDELRRYLNQAVKVIALKDPLAVSKTIVMALAEGTYQELPTGQRLMAVTRNITSAVNATPRVSGPIVTPITAVALNSSYRNWHNNAYVPFSATVSHIITEPTNPNAFWVFPGNDGTGKLEVTVAETPDDIPAPSNITDSEAYTTDVPLDPRYEPALMDYMLYRAFSKDSDKQASQARAVAHMQSFNGTVDQLRASENGTSLAGQTLTTAAGG